MAKSQRHSNREAKKPKQVKAAAPAPSEGLLGQINPPSPLPNKKRA